MDAIVGSPWVAVALVAALTHLKLFVLAAIQGVTRLWNRRFVKPEDAAFFGRGVAPASEEHPRVVLAQRAIDNELENLPTFALALVAHAALGGDARWALGLGAAFVLARAVHSAAYVSPRQPLRNRAYVTGQLVTFTLLVRVAITALSRT
jgi:uncharacterized MAPEG superfamily protein